MKKKIVFIGNSIVNGFPLSRGKSFPGLIRARVKEGSVPFRADVINKGANGETTAQIVERFVRDVLVHEPAAVFFLSGTNDFIYREATPREAFAHMEAMAGQALARGIVPVYMTPLFVDSAKATRMWMAGTGIDYEEVNARIEEFTALLCSSDRPLIDTGAAFRQYAEEVGEEAYLDGVHPTAEGYRFLAETTADWISRNADILHLEES
ncbi:MAG: GDSL-type esterase/lipase family protein [Bacillota bacterium]|nr:GDSL-type esterase/lipase family protein [Bacillota bacterium]